MARPPKKGIEYFPFDADFLNNIKVRRILRGCGAGSIAVLIYLLGNIYKDEGYYMRWNNEIAFVISDSVGVTEGLVQETLNKALQVGFFNEEMFNKYKILTSKGVQKRYFLATDKRVNDHIIEEYIIVNETETGVSDTGTRVKVSESTQKKKKVNKSKLNNNNNNTVVDEKVAEIAKLYEKSGFGQINSLIAESIKDISEDYNLEWIAEAFKIAADNNKHNLAYVKGILENWRSKGKTSSKVNEPKKTKFHNFKQLSDDYPDNYLDDLAKQKRDALYKQLKEEDAETKDIMKS